ncbi:MAG: hypothetical protein L0H53_14145, partial [Candidatus Nitrosocosmicus sp.]|nr:hypothetical protein [Candidatus Nitrosocosmicus sp.]
SSKLYNVGKENKTQSRYSINEKEQRQYTAIVKIIIITRNKMEYENSLGFLFNVVLFSNSF